MKNVIFITSGDVESRDTHIINVAKICMKIGNFGGGWPRPEDGDFLQVISLLEKFTEHDYDECDHWYLVREVQSLPFEFVAILNLLIDQATALDNFKLFISCPADAIINCKVRLPQVIVRNGY